MSSVKLDVCIAPLAELGYDDDLDMVREGDDEEVADMLRAISAVVGVKKPAVKKFTRELEKLRSEPANREVVEHGMGVEGRKSELAAL